ncbi:hypothetical protein ASG22_05750 [Chryseobacterium sp. Leaf405]|uniref:hypothetical protein n=1 Tax=Chryseobacterium sp. Leaf405 TaxID=1736367 RepID=UPI0006F40103|nr:hypothetical protein [Chryseobacterium sp. Leaf405]KQT26173.1 hypothetical protein ASG22_05750 [Chryseobacterium sp. Leaf405]
MELKNEILEIIKITEAKHLNDPTVSNEMDLLTQLMLIDVNNTIVVLEELEIENILWLSSDFEELSYKFQSKEFIECLKKLEDKYPNKMSSEIQNAIEAYYGD